MWQKLEYLGCLSKEIHSKLANTFYETDKTVVKHTEKTWSSYLLDMIDYEIKMLKNLERFYLL